jgi:hypothetical protein
MCGCKILPNAPGLGVKLKLFTKGIRIQSWLGLAWLGLAWPGFGMVWCDFLKPR